MEGERHEGTRVRGPEREGKGGMNGGKWRSVKGGRLVGGQASIGERQREGKEQ